MQTSLQYGSEVKWQFVNVHSIIYIFKFVRNRKIRRALSSGVERLLRMLKVKGSIPLASIFCTFLQFYAGWIDKAHFGWS